MAKITRATFWMWRDSSYTFNHELSLFHTSISPANLVYHEQVNSSVIPTTPSLYNWELDIQMEPGKNYFMVIGISASDLFTRLSSFHGFQMAVDWTIDGFTSGTLISADFDINSEGWASTQVSNLDYPYLLALPENGSVTSSWNAASKTIGLNFSGTLHAMESILNAGAIVNGTSAIGSYNLPFEFDGIWRLQILVSAAAAWQPGAVIKYSPFMLIPTDSDPFFTTIPIGGTSWFGVTPRSVSGVILPEEPRKVGDVVLFTKGDGSVSTNVSWMNSVDEQIFSLGSVSGDSFVLPTLPEGGEYTGRLRFVSVAEHGGVGKVASTDPFTYSEDTQSDTPSNPSPADNDIDTSPLTEWLSWVPADGMLDQRVLFDFASGVLSHQITNQILGFTNEVDPVTGRSYVNIKNILSDLQWPLYREETFRWRVDTKFSEEDGYEEGPEWTFTTPDYPADLQPFPEMGAEDVKANIPYLGVVIPSDAKRIEFWKDSTTFSVDPLDRIRDITVTDEMRELGPNLTILSGRENWTLPPYYTWPLTGRQTPWHVRVHYNSK